ncbi:MFS transporter [Iamia majanohamensis]|uniref:MFS transporter n=1 Tax=Iamia majanohamensis TaxID=467976 RepID=A0AAF0BWG2_9ACTN|nr:MFS transporter [Iamia majanohamensis]WCO68018.1 MFS transporter [Iamia majanohamensis]
MTVRRRPLRALVGSNPELGRLLAAHAVSRAGDAFNTVALVVLVFELTGSGTGVAGTVAFEVLPVLALGPIAGMVVDRRPRRSVMIAADLARALLVASLAVVGGSVLLAFAVAFGVSAATVAFNPAASSLLPEVVDREDLVDANALLWTVAVVAQIVLAPAAGGLISLFGVHVAFAVNAASYLISALILTGLRAGRSPSETALRGWGSVMAGVAAVRGVPLLRRLAIVQGLASLSAGATSGLLVVFAADALDVGPGGFGLLLAAIGVGAALGPMLFRSRIAPGDRRWLFGPFATRGGVDLLLGVTSNPAVAGAALGLYGASTSTGMVAYQSTLQSAVPAETRGRAFALYDVVWNAARLVSLGIGGILADALGIRAVYILGGVLLLAAAAVGLTTPISAPDDHTSSDGPP